MADTTPRKLGELLTMAQRWIDEAFGRIDEADPAYDAAVRDYNDATAAIASMWGRIGSRPYDGDGTIETVDLAAEAQRGEPGAARLAERGPVEGNALVGKDQPPR